MTMERLKVTDKFKAKFKKGDDLEEYLSKLVSWTERMVFNRTSARVNFLLDRMETLAVGTADGQMLVWNDTTKKWTPTAITDLIFINGRMGINNSTPNERLDVVGTIMKTRDLTGGVTR